MPDRKPIVVVGSINMDLVASTARIPVEGETVTGNGFQVHPGGKGANQAVAVARLGYPVHLIGRLGDDGFGAQLRGHLEEAGVEVSGVMTTPGSSGVAVIVVAENGENCIVVVPGANALLTPQDLDAKVETIHSAGIVLAQLEVPVETVEHLAAICTEAGVPLMLDPAPARALPAELLARVSWFTPNETEAEFFIAKGAEGNDTSRIAEELLGRGMAGVVLKLGSRGAWVQKAGGVGQSVASYKVEAVDTTAAGDAFNGAFATGLMLGKEPIEAACFAAAAAAVSVTRAGAQPSMATMDEVEALMGSDA